MNSYPIALGDKQRVFLIATGKNGKTLNNRGRRLEDQCGEKQKRGTERRGKRKAKSLLIKAEEEGDEKKKCVMDGINFFTINT